MSSATGRSRTTSPFCSPTTRVQYRRASSGWCRLTTRVPWGLAVRRRSRTSDARAGSRLDNRLVGEHQLGVLHEQAGDGHPLALAARQPFGALVHREPEPDPIEGGHDGRVRAGHDEGHERAGGAPLAEPPGVDVVQDPHLVDEVETLADRADAALDGAESGGGEAGERGAEDLDGAAARRQGAVEQGEQRALAGPARTEQPDPLTRLDDEVDAVQGDPRAEPPFDTGQAHGRPDRRHVRRPREVATVWIWS